jgi:hypothetical protein
MLLVKDKGDYFERIGIVTIKHQEYTKYQQNNAWTVNQKGINKWLEDPHGQRKKIRLG